MPNEAASIAERERDAVPICQSLSLASKVPVSDRQREGLILFLITVNVPSKVTAIFLHVEQVLELIAPLDK